MKTRLRKDNMKILDIDMDIFQSDIYLKMFEDDERPDSDEYYPWKKEKFITFLEKNLKLNRNSRIKGCFVRDHHHIYYYIRDQLESSNITIPFKFVHVDAHLDMGGYSMDSTWSYITSCFIKKDKKMRYYPENLNDYYQYSSFSCSNFLLYAAANEWFESFTYVHHQKLIEYDFPPYYIKKDLVIPNEFLMGLNEIRRGLLDFQVKTIFDIFPNCRIEIPLICTNIENYKAEEKFDRVCISHSPTYACEGVDELLEILKEYIDFEYVQD